ncbi:B2 bradykinin receptor-like [Amphiprion ocellaris]|uniref:B2 bradykinin receptor-like n=1 Tax=Amphiprion ocellaris TaxID=80972 RepID=UPI0024119302|nr:B2 bradykinin receptor-like [Amphiprion ocellaris]
MPMLKVVCGQQTGAANCNQQDWQAGALSNLHSSPLKARRCHYSSPDREPPLLDHPEPPHALLSSITATARIPPLQHLSVQAGLHLPHVTSPTLPRPTIISYPGQLSSLFLAEPVYNSLYDNVFSGLLLLTINSILANFSHEAVDENQNNTDETWCLYDPVDWIFTGIPVYILIISVLGIFLNVFVLMVFWLHKKACTVAEIYLSNLAAADLFLMSPFPVLAVIAVTKYDLHLSETVCKLVPFSVNINVYCSIIILALVSIDRYLALVHPLTSGRMRRPFYAKVACVLVWGVCFLLNVPTAIYREVVHDSEGNFTTCDLNFPSPSMYLVFQGIRVFIFIIPTFLISFCTLRIIHALSGTLKKELNAQKKEQKATTLVLVVLLAFLICWMPTYMVSILYLLSGVNILNSCRFFSNLHHFRVILTSLALSNSVLNPILYVILGTNFQTKVKELFMQISTNL